jgi:hypothetical protein
MILLFSQVFYLGVFATNDGFIVVRENDMMCGRFIPGTTIAPNWLPSGWQAV